MQSWEEVNWTELFAPHPTRTKRFAPTSPQQILMPTVKLPRIAHQQPTQCLPVAPVSLSIYDIPDSGDCWDSVGPIEPVLLSPGADIQPAHHCFWSRYALSTASCRCVSCARSSSNAVAGRASTAAGRRRLYIGNSVTVLYSAIFATAMMFDADAKTRRRTEMEKRIEAMKEEVKELQIEEARILDGLAARRKVRKLALPLQRRQYSTVSATALQPPAARWGYQSSDPSSNPLLAESVENKESITVRDRPEMITDVFDKELPKEWDPAEIEERFKRQNDLAAQDVLREKAMQILAMRQLTIKMLLRPSIAHSYDDVIADYGESFDHPRIKLQDYLAELQTIKRRITRLRFQEKEPFDDLVRNVTILEQDTLRQQRQELHNSLQDTFTSYRRREITLQRLLLAVSENLLASEEPILPQTVELMITQFTRNKQNDLVRMVINSLLPNRVRMTPPIIVSTINFYSKTKDLFGFDWLLRLLQGDSVSVNLSLLWETVRVGDVEITVPPKPRHQFMMEALISATLSFNQPQKADAYLHLFRRSGYNEGIYTLAAYLRFYTVSPNWRKGGFVVLRTVAYIMSTKSHKDGTINRLILYMIDLCNSCKKHELSAVITKAAVEAGIDWRPSDNKRDRRRSILEAIKQWRLAAEDIPADISACNKTFGERCYDFAKKIEQPIQRSLDYSKPAQLHDVHLEQKYIEDSFSLRHAGQMLQSRDGEPTADAPSYPNHIEPLSHEVNQIEERFAQLRHEQTENSFNAESTGRTLELRKEQRMVSSRPNPKSNPPPRKPLPLESKPTKESGPMDIHNAENGSVHDKQSNEEQAGKSFIRYYKIDGYQPDLKLLEKIDPKSPISQELQEIQREFRRRSRFAKDHVVEYRRMFGEICSALFYSLAISQKAIKDFDRQLRVSGVPRD
ncbi:hypothetical protein AJ79_03216 [Helicocarpus griseus UAMH5409]|uniref:Uncharacterized protein n=1 Tax=Helicocarpus griseus UAMH5409 TaxID=1447875 RepID=A0A2B7XYV2_9EURO|nr:hypothetical protein AJ79_03216 [Helicocarpus griseus UAMH5409]